MCGVNKEGSFRVSLFCPRQGVTDSGIRATTSEEQRLGDCRTPWESAAKRQRRLCIAVDTPTEVFFGKLVGRVHKLPERANEGLVEWKTVQQRLFLKPAKFICIAPRYYR